MNTIVNHPSIYTTIVAVDTLFKKYGMEQPEYLLLMLDEKSTPRCYFALPKDVQLKFREKYKEALDLVRNGNYYIHYHVKSLGIAKSKRSGFPSEYNDDTSEGITIHCERLPKEDFDNEYIYQCENCGSFFESYYYHYSSTESEWNRGSSHGVNHYTAEAKYTIVDDNGDILCPVCFMKLTERVKLKDAKDKSLYYRFGDIYDSLLEQSRSSYTDHNNGLSLNTESIRSDPLKLEKFLSILVDHYAYLKELEELKGSLSSPFYNSEFEYLSRLVDTTPLPRISLPKLPIKPSVLYTEVKKPELVVPGFFNKKKIAAQNATLLEKYEIDKKNLNEKKAIAQADYLNELANYEKERKIAQKEFKKASAERISIFNRSNVAENNIVSKLILSELKVIAENIVSTQAQIDMLLATGIIYEKYQDFVCVSTMLDYIRSGRCCTLEGENGCYNKFEEESRLDTIITKLNNIESALNKITKNQYVLYSKLNDIQKSIKEHGKALEDILTDCRNGISLANKQLSDIAYYSKATAYYAEKQTYLLDTLGVIVAMQ